MRTLFITWARGRRYILRGHAVACKCGHYILRGHTVACTCGWYILRGYAVACTCGRILRAHAIPISLTNHRTLLPSVILYTLD
jgi:hypothetical protein